jgi:hypothetical protein
LNKEGQFDYEKYRFVQEEGNKRKISSWWTQKENIYFVADLVSHRLSELSFGICQGTRRGLEQQWFIERLGINVVGTEISETAMQFPNTIQWDFHEVKSDWVGKADFIYSNSYDHAYDPAKCFNAWMAMLRGGGLCVLEYTSMNSSEGVSELDPFGIDRDDLVDFLNSLGSGRFVVSDVITTFPFKPAAHMVDLAYLVVQRF